jgi:hypothetical protein
MLKQFEYLFIFLFYFHLKLWYQFVLSQFCINVVSVLLIDFEDSERVTCVARYLNFVLTFYS